MASPRVDLSQPEAQKTRTELTLTRIAREWYGRPSGRRFVAGLVDFIRSLTNPSTARTYSYAVLELFEHLEQESGRVPLPSEIRRADAAAYEAWLASRPLGLRRFRLSQDPRRRLDVYIWDVVAAKPGCGIGHIRSELLKRPELTTTVSTERGLARVLRIEAAFGARGGLARRLACLVSDHTLVRSPSVAELRRRGVLFVGEEPDEKAFRYYLPRPPTAPGPERASGIVTRLTALSSLWGYMARAGENAPGESEPLLRYNVWTEPLARARAVAPSHQEARRERTTPGMDLFVALLATTYEQSHGPGANRAAELAAYSRPVPRGRGRESFADLRDRAMLLIMLQPGGPRADELRRMRLGDVRAAPSGADARSQPLLTIVGKGGRARTVPVPPGALDALRGLWAKLRQLAEHQLRYRGYSRAGLLLAPDAPLLPAISHWGANAGIPATRPLGRSGLAMALRRRAERAGFDPGSAAFRRIHPHGFRRLFALEAVRGGTPLNVVQGMMGHASGVSTLRYAEEKAPERLVAEPFRGVAPPTAEARPPAPAPAPPPAVAGPRKPAPRRPPTVRKPVERPRRAPPEPLPEPEIEPVEVLVEAAPEPPPQERLVGLGEAPERGARAEEVTYWQGRLKRVLGPSEAQQLAECAAEPTTGAERLCATYRLDWGERGERERLALGAEERELAGVEAAALEAELAALGVERPAELGAETGPRLEHTYAGTESGLVWWAGHAGLLKPEMPVVAWDQLGDCSEDQDSGLCAELASLWREWMLAQTVSPTSQPEVSARGPTSACALVGWVSEALAESAVVRSAVEARGGSWVEGDAPWSETKPEGKDRRVFRQHALRAVRGWFAEVAWQWQTGRGRVGRGALSKSTRLPKVTGRMPEAPAWYGESDPLASLPRADRQEALDFAAALTGDYSLRDRTPRFRGASRYDLARVIEAMRRYEEEEKTVRDLKTRRRAGEAADADVARARSVADEAAEAADRLVWSVGGPSDFSLKPASAERVKRRKAEKRGREYLGDFYLRLLGELFGAEAAADPLLKLAADKKKPALTPYRELLHPDFAVGTVVHSPRYAEAFARATGAHSECVARRIVRELYELWKSGRRGSGAFKRRKDLLDLVDAMAAFRVPCPRAQEQELRAWLGPAEPVAIYERFREAREREVRIEPRETEILEEVFAPFEEEFAAERERELRYLENPLARPLRYNRQVAERLPTPLEARLAVLTTR